MWTDAETAKCFSNTWIGCYCCWCENTSESDKDFVNEGDSDCHEAVVSDREMQEAK